MILINLLSGWILCENLISFHINCESPYLTVGPLFCFYMVPLSIRLFFPTQIYSEPGYGGDGMCLPWTPQPTPSSLQPLTQTTLAPISLLWARSGVITVGATQTVETSRECGAGPQLLL